MDTDEILEKAREENEGRQDEREMDVRLKATRASYAVGLLMCCAVMILSMAFTGRIDMTAEMIWLAMFGVDATMVGRKLGHAFTMWCGIIIIACDIILFVCYVISLAAKGA